MTLKENKNPIKVNAYSGYKANERPLSFFMGDLEIRVIKIIDRWSHPDRDYFTVKGDDRKKYTLFWERETDLWFLLKK